MNIKGMMDGWHGDESSCHGYCGVCESCELEQDQWDDQEYESYQQELLESLYD